MNRSRIWLPIAGLAAIGLTFNLTAADDAKPTAAKAADTAPAAAKVGEFATPTDAINHFIREGYKKAKIASPSGKATEAEFLRRAFIDLLGRVATVEEVLDYEADSSPNKRAKLINRLLHGANNKDSKSRDYTPKVNGQPVKLEGKNVLTFDYPDLYAQNWANIWTVWLMTRTGNPLYRNQMKVWLESKFLDNSNHKDMVMDLLTSKGRSNENGAVNFIIHHLGEAVPADKQAEVGKFDAVPITSRVTRLFLGVQTNCTQCHDHPFNKEWTQADFWGVNAFFRQTLRDRTPTGGAERRMTEPVQVTLSDDTKYNPEQIIFYERRDGKLMASKPNFLKDLAVAESGDSSSKPFGKPDSKSRREVLAEYVTNHDNFAKAYVNRIWGHLFGRGLNKEATIDDFGSHNEVIHPELLEYLAAQFVKYNYDPKKLLEWICTSDVYSLSHVANPSYIDPKYDAYFARMPLKALAPEVLYHSLETITKADLVSDKVARGRNREDFEAKLVRNFGDDEGNEMTFNGTVVQALLMMNGKEVNEELTRKSANNPVNRIVAKHSKGGATNANATIDEIFLTVLNRHPTSTESMRINNVLTKGAVIASDKPAAKDAPAPTPKPAASATPKSPKEERKEKMEAMMQKKGGSSTTVPEGPRAVNASNPNDPTFYQDLFWALINTNEFMLNH